MAAAAAGAAPPADTSQGTGIMQPFKPYHQLATFAPSKDDILNTLGFFFGKPAQPEKLADFSEHHAATYHFPDAYVGKNVHLRDTLNNLVLSSPQEWQTNVVLPWMKIDGVTVTWDEVHFDVRLLQRVPYEGASRMQTSIRRSHRDRVVRRGVALMLESDFYRTEQGRKYFSDQITSIRYCVQETCNFDVLFALLTCHNYDHVRYRSPLAPLHTHAHTHIHTRRRWEVVDQIGLLAVESSTSPTVCHWVSSASTISSRTPSVGWCANTQCVPRGVDTKRPSQNVQGPRMRSGARAITRRTARRSVRPIGHGRRPTPIACGRYGEACSSVNGLHRMGLLPLDFGIGSKPHSGVGKRASRARLSTALAVQPSNSLIILKRSCPTAQR